MKTAVTEKPRSSDSTAPRRLERLQSIDILRGLVMVLMALDHTRDYFTDAPPDPTNDFFAHGSAGLFFTRWVTHFCAPVFFLLAGTGAYLSGSRGKSPSQLSWFLITRGGFLILLELTVVRFAWDFNFDYQGGPLLMVIYALGAAMIVLAGLVFLPLKWIGGIGIAMIVTHNLCDDVTPESLGRFSSLWPLWALLHVRGPEEVAGLPFYVSYPLVPWVGVMAAGYALGAVMKADRRTRRRNLVLLGSALTVGFIVLRAVNIYGDPHPWQVEEGAIPTLLAFLNTTKYPPSLAFLLMTLGPALLTLAWFDGADGRVARWFMVFGRVPLFFYVAHLYLIHALALLLGTLYGFDARSLCDFHTDFPTNYGFGLPTVYLMWLLVVLALYPPSAWFANLKKRSKQVWLSYL